LIAGLAFGNSSDCSLSAEELQSCLSDFASGLLHKIAWLETSVDSFLLEAFQSQLGQKPREVLANELLSYSGSDETNILNGVLIFSCGIVRYHPGVARPDIRVTRYITHNEK
jgi:hypothetical protein